MKYILIGIIKFYQKFVSPLFPPCCRYYPTCSSYALEAVRKFGFFKGGWLACCRILRCNPWHSGGVDYVPDEFVMFNKKNKR